MKRLKGINKWAVLQMMMQLTSRKKLAKPLTKVSEEIHSGFGGNGLFLEIH